MDTAQSRQREIESVFERLGIATANQRDMFIANGPSRPVPSFNVVISATSSPHFG